MEQIKVILAEDSDILRRSLALALGLDDSLSVLGEAINGRELVELCRTRPPDVAVVDIRMPIMDGIEATRIIKAEWPKVKVLILTTFDDDEYLRELFALGVDGYLLKNEDQIAIASAVKSVYIGFNTLDKGIVQKLAALMNGTQMNAGGLTELEGKVARMIADGLYNKDIARELSISYGYARNIVSEVCRKVGAADRGDMVDKLREKGMG